jgi:hypothetical protein
MNDTFLNKNISLTLSEALIQEIGSRLGGGMAEIILPATEENNVLNSSEEIECRPFCLFCCL